MKIAVAALGNFHANPFEPKLQVKQKLSTLKKKENKSAALKAEWGCLISRQSLFKFSPRIESKNRKAIHGCAMLKGEVAHGKEKGWN